MACPIRRVVRGDTASFQLPVTLEGNPYNTAGCSFLMTGRSTSRTGPQVFQISSPANITPIGPTADGLMRVRIPPATTSLFVPGETIYYDVQMTDAAGDVWTLELGEIETEQDVTT